MDNFNNENNYTDPANYTDPDQNNGKGNGLAIASMVIGIVNLITCCLPILGFPVSITGLVLGILSRNSEKKKMAVAGIIMCAIGLVLTIVNAILGAVMGASGQIPWQQ